MKALLAGTLVALLTGCGGYQRIGSMTMISTRNVDSSRKYELVARGVEAVAKMKQDDALQVAVEKACALHPGGEYMMNVAVSVKENGKAVKVVGDVWGMPTQTGTATPVQTGSVGMKPGDKVAYRANGGMVSGTIIGVRNTVAVVEVVKDDGSKRMKEIDLVKLTLIQ